MSQSNIWQSFGQRSSSNEFERLAANEFQEELPIESNDMGILDAKSPRRDFLKYLGFSTAAASLAASCEMPVKKAIPFVNKPENIVPGVANYYATTYTQDGDVVSIVAKVRDGRPIKIEGNELCPITKGGTSARVQASVLDLYDTARLRFPAQINNGELAEVPTFEAFDKMVAEGFNKLDGKSVVLLTSSITSPTSNQIISEFLVKFPGSRHVTYDAVSYNALLLANEASYGKKALPSYHFENAKIIVSLGADFLGTWLSPVEFAKQYSVGRKINEKEPELSKHYQFESILSMTGANADERFTHKPSQTGKIAVALYNAVVGNPVSGLDSNLSAAIIKVAKDLKSHIGQSLVVSNSTDVNVQLLVNAINEAVGANGKTINWANTSNYRQGIDADMAKLVSDMNAGAVGALLILDVNPAYDYPAADKFIAGMSKLKFSISFNSKLDETTALCKWVIPNHHFLESWGDAEGKTGCVSFQQPTIHPLFKTRQWQDTLLKWTGSSVDYLGYFKAYWSNVLGGQEGFDNTLRDGVWQKSPIVLGATSFSAVSIANAVSSISSKSVPAGNWEVVLYEKVAIRNGSQASNPWLQEMPDPITKATWDNYAMISAAAAKELLGIDISKTGDSDTYEVHPEKEMLLIKVNGKEIKLPVLIIPGTDKYTVGIALGYGRSEKAGVALKDAGKNAFPLAAIIDGTVHFSLANATVAKANEKYKIAQNQVYNYYTDSLGNKRVEVVKETSLATFNAHPQIFKAERDKLVEDYAQRNGDYRNEGSLYDPRLNDRPGIHWGMSIDLNSCNGCGACIVACNAENNIPVVGKTEVLRGHDMHWIRIDRYFVNKTGSANPDELSSVVFMPMLCQHCDNAPCENVCPVAATNHSSEGLNQMTYNRCIGTRYCANNCPYKVRRFNWADYTGADSFQDNQVGHISDVTLEMNDDLYRMVLNPDVTVRSRGVIEKCSFCVQRLQEGKLSAKKESRPLKDGEVKTACQSACPPNAIVFGNANDKSSLITATRHENPLRMYYALEQIHVLPNVNYMAKVRNTEELMAVEEAQHAGNHEVSSDSTSKEGSATPKEAQHH